MFHKISVKDISLKNNKYDVRFKKIYQIVFQYNKDKFNFRDKIRLYNF